MPHREAHGEKTWPGRGPVRPAGFCLRVMPAGFCLRVMPAGFCLRVMPADFCLRVVMLHIRACAAYQYITNTYRFYMWLCVIFWGGRGGGLFFVK